MGATAAICLAAEGARVIGCDLAAAAAVATEKAVRDAGGDITVMGGVALGDADQAKAWVESAVAMHGRPGLVETPKSAPRPADPHERARRVVLDRIPLVRHGQAEAGVNAAAFVSFDKASGAGLWSSRRRASSRHHPR